MSRRNDATITVHPSPAPAAQRPRRPGSQRQPLARRRDRAPTPTALPPNASPTAPARLRGRLPHRARHLGYAATVHSAQGVTADSCYATPRRGRSRAMLYVAMTRGRHTNEAFLYQRSPMKPTTTTPRRCRQMGSTSPARQQILGRTTLPKHPGQRRPTTHHARRSRTHPARCAASGSCRIPPTGRTPPPSPSDILAVADEDGAELA